MKKPRILLLAFMLLAPISVTAKTTTTIPDTLGIEPPKIEVTTHGEGWIGPIAGAAGVVLAATIGFGGVVMTANVAIKREREAATREEKSKRESSEKAEKHRLDTLRAALRAELNQLIDVMQGEIGFADSADWTWIPIRDYFEVYRRHIDLIGLLSEQEVELLTATVHIMEERLGYIWRRATGSLPETEALPDPLLPPVSPPIGRNIFFRFGGKGSLRDRDSLKEDLGVIVDAATKARDEISKILKTPAPDLERPSKSTTIPITSRTLDDARALASAGAQARALESGDPAERG